MPPQAGGQGQIAEKCGNNHSDPLIHCVTKKVQEIKKTGRKVFYLVEMHFPSIPNHSQGIIFLRLDRFWVRSATQVEQGKKSVTTLKRQWLLSFFFFWAAGILIHYHPLPAG